MPVGTVENVIVCRVGLPAGTVGNIVGPASGCTDPTGVRGLPVTIQAYVIDPSQQGAYEAALGPFDYAVGSQFFAFGFIGIATLYFACHGIGLVLKSVRDA